MSDTRMRGIYTIAATLVVLLVDISHFHQHLTPTEDLLGGVIFALLAIAHRSKS